MAAFLLWAIVGIAFLGYGIYAIFSGRPKPFGFWANAEMFPVGDVKGYNRALGILFCVFGAVFTLLGLPLLTGSGRKGLIIIPILGGMAESIAAMAVYILVIERRFRK